MKPAVNDHSSRAVSKNTSLVPYIRKCELFKPKIIINILAHSDPMGVSQTLETGIAKEPVEKLAVPPPHLVPYNWADDAPQWLPSYTEPACQQKHEPLQMPAPTCSARYYADHYSA